MISYQVLTKIILAGLALLCSYSIFAQTVDSSASIRLPAIVVRVFEQNRKLKEVPAAVNYIGKQTLESFGTSSIVSAVNTTPGVRMEERSPGSYRFNIRGSSLRSPFGVRNVKVYYNDIPFTDPGGQTYVNQLGYYNFNSIEIIKGPNNSLYGAGTGGAMLIESLSEKENAGVSSEDAFGSYHLQNYYASLSSVSDKSISRVSFQHQENEGYREHSALKRNVYNWNGLFRLGEGKLLKTTFLYGDLFYQTPGALTRSEFMANPKAARPSGPVFPGAIAANTYIRQKMFLAGASYTQPITSKLENKTVLYGMFTDFRNPNINNYDKSAEPHAGGRTVFNFEQPVKNAVLRIDAGGEYQQGFTEVNIFKNVMGSPDTLRTTDDINNVQSLLFTQVSLDIKNWTIITGASWNTLRIKFQRFVPATLGQQQRKFDNQIAPRFALMKNFKKINIYSSVSRGFSPPTTDELLPTGGAINIALNAETGVNYDVGFRGNFLKDIYVDMNLFFFGLKNTIVQRRDAGGGQYFINAGKTKQHGLETFISYPLPLSFAHFKRSLFFISHTWHDFHYKEFKQVANDFSGNRLPSIPQQTISTGVDIFLQNGLSFNLNYFYSDKIPLNDANSEYASPYHLIGAKLGFEKSFKNKFQVKVYGGADNLLNQTYSLGNDINGFGGRYYNAAAGRNFYAALVLQYLSKSR